MSHLSNTNSGTREMRVPFELSDKTLLHNECYVDGQWYSSLSGKYFVVDDPGSGSEWATCPDCIPEDVDNAVKTAHSTFQVYSRMNPRKRAQLLSKWHQLILSAKDDLAKILVYETGKPLAEACGEIEYGASFVWWFSGEADRIRGTTLVAAADSRRSVTIKQPIGVAAALVPWNFPIALVLRKVSAALAAGCTILVKPSPETPITALALADLATRAGFPQGAFNVLTTSLENTPAVAQAMCTHPLVKKVTFTGSTRVGKIISRLCADNLKKSTCELGGNCPLICFADADLDVAIDQMFALKWRHAGQACITANRVYVERSVYDEFTQRLVQRTKTLVLGHGLDSKTTLGPVTVERSLPRLEDLVVDAVEKGAKIVLGTGKRIDEKEATDLGRGYFMKPTILINMTEDMQMTHEEIFGPVLGLYAFDTEKEVTDRANATPYGLASYVFTNDTHRVWRMMENLEAGMIGVNVGNSSAAEAPFGGMKDSGWGKESGKDVAIDEYLISKTCTMLVKDHY